MYCSVTKSGYENANVNIHQQQQECTRASFSFVSSDLLGTAAILGRSCGHLRREALPILFAALVTLMLRFRVCIIQCIILYIIITNSILSSMLYHHWYWSYYLLCILSLYVILLVYYHLCYIIIGIVVIILMYIIIYIISLVYYHFMLYYYWHWYCYLLSAALATPMLRFRIYITTLLSSVSS